MRKILCYVLFWMLSGGLYLRSNAGIIADQQISEPYTISVVITEDAPVQLKDIDVCHPLFILK